MRLGFYGPNTTTCISRLGKACVFLGLGLKGYFIRQFPRCLSAMAEIARAGKRKLEEGGIGGPEEKFEKGGVGGPEENFEKGGVGGPEDCSDDSDGDLVMYVGDRKMSIELQNEYHRQIRESEGFDITLDLTLKAPLGAPIIPRRGKENKPTFVELSKLAIEDFNSHNGTKYEFVKNVTVNTSCASGMWCHITFQARDADVDAIGDDDSNALKTFQTLAWSGIDGVSYVKFCRFKKPSPVIEGDERAPDSDVDAKSTQ